MEDKIRRYIYGAFAEVPPSEKATGTRDEILQNILDKYNDLKAAGKSEEDAYALAISAAGDLSVIIEDLKRGAPAVRTEQTSEKKVSREKKKCGFFDSILWPVTAVIYFAAGFFAPFTWAFSWNIFILAAAVSTFYRFVITESDRKRKKRYLNGFIWTFTTFLYFAASFATFRWDLTWLMFILAIPVSKIADILVFREDYDTEDN